MGEGVYNKSTEKVLCCQALGVSSRDSQCGELGDRVRWDRPDWGPKKYGIVASGVL